jgi:hypothetical protein
MREQLGTAWDTWQCKDRYGKVSLESHTTGHSFDCEQRAACAHEQAAEGTFQVRKADVSEDKKRLAAPLSKKNRVMKQCKRLGFSNFNCYAFCTDSDETAHFSTNNQTEYCNLEHAVAHRQSTRRADGLSCVLQTQRAFSWRGYQPQESTRSCLLLALALELRQALLEDEGSLVLADSDLLHGDLDAHLVVRASGLGASVLLVGVVLAAAGIEDGDDGALRERSTSCIRHRSTAHLSVAQTVAFSPEQKAFSRQAGAKFVRASIEVKKRERKTVFFDIMYAELTRRSPFLAEAVAGRSMGATTTAAPAPAMTSRRLAERDICMRCK